MPPKYKSQIGILARDLQKRVAVHRSRIAAAFEIYLGLLARQGGADRLVYAPFRRRAYLCSPCTRLKRALGLKFNPSGLGILNLSGFGLWRSDLLACRVEPYPR